MKKFLKLISGNYAGISRGEVVELVRVEEERYDLKSGFTWPEYTTVKTKDGRTVIGHSYRFERVSEMEDDNPHKSNL